MKMKIKLGVQLFRIYLYNWLLLIDWALNIALLGKPGQTVSARLYHADGHLAKFAELLIDLVFSILFNEPHHCREAALNPSEPVSIKEAYQVLRQHYF